ncbi:MAG: TetR/AcrR family transcriptional regulator [Ilumatobacteraceae bacterium]
MTTADQDLDPRVERSRAAVLAAAYDLLIADGPDAVVHGQVAAAARVSRTTVYKHFPTRGELLRATIEVMGKPVPAELTGDLRTDLQRLLADLVADLSDDQRTRAIAAMIERAQHDPTVAAVRDGIVCEAHEQFRTIVEQGITSGALRDDIDADLAMSGLMGTFFFKRFMAGEQIDDDLAARAVDAFVAAHSAR